MMQAPFVLTTAMERQYLAFPPWIVHDRLHQFIVDVATRCLLWRRLGEKDSGWAEIALPGGRVPYQVRADGQDLMVLDTQGDVHYAKTQEGGKSLVERLKWQRGISDFPVIGEIFNRFVYKDPNIHVQKEGAWACSFLEGGCFYRDGLDRKHFLGDCRGEIGSTTTGYVADLKRRVFRFYDPYLFKGPEDAEKIFIPFPETSKTIFELKGFAAKRSGLFLVGYDVSRAKQGGVVKDLALYFISADANLLGLNPMIRYRYAFNSDEASDFILPASLYRRIPLPAGGITPQLGMSRAVGKSNLDVILTVEGVGPDGVVGWYSKGLAEEGWSFHPEPGHPINKEAILVLRDRDEAGKFESSVCDFSGIAVKGGNLATLENFGENSLQSTVTVSVGGEKVGLKLYPRESQWNILGFRCTDYYLVASESGINAFGLGGDAVVEVEVVKGEGRVRIMKGCECLFEFSKNLRETDQAGYCVVC